MGQDVPQSMESLVDSQESLGAGYTERVIPAPFFFGAADPRRLHCGHDARSAVAEPACFGIRSGV